MEACIIKQENCPDDDNKISSKRSNSSLQLPELPDEVWIQIIWKLPIKAIHAFKCVSKACHSLVSYILTTQKGLDLPPHGLLFQTLMRYPDHDDDHNDDDVVLDVEKREFYLGYLSLVGGDNKFTKWSLDENGDDGLNGIASVTITDQTAQKAKGVVRDFYDDHGRRGTLMLGNNLSLEFSCFVGSICRAKEHRFWHVHRGLILSVLDLHTYRVSNPATNEAFVVCRPASEASLSRGSWQVAIINLSDCLLSTECNFRVLRFVKANYRRRAMVFVEVYSSNKREWCVSKFPLKKAVIEENWYVPNGVFVNNTLFFLTNKRHVVGVQLHSSSEQVMRVYSLLLPHNVKRGFVESRLDVSQGDLYLSYFKFPMGPNLRIWKYTQSSTVANANAWIPQLKFKKSGISLCKPVIQNFIRQFVGETHPLIIHPEAPVLFVSVRPSIFAFHLLNDTVEKILELNEREVPLFGCTFMYSPCFASFNCLKAANQDHCK